MALIPQVTCRRCGEKYSAMRRRCPKCSTRRVQNSRRAPGTTPSAVKGTAAQIKSTELTAAFTGGTVNTVTVPFTFDSDDFTAPGDYIFSLTETAAGITGLTQDTAARYIVVRVVNTDPAAPTGALRIRENELED